MADLTELESVQGRIAAISKEIKNLNASRKKLKDIEQDINNRIADFLKSKNQIGLKYKGKAILIEHNEKRTKKPNRERDADSISVLEKLGVRSPEKALKQIMEARQGEKMQTEKLKIQKIKNAE